MRVREPRCCFVWCSIMTINNVATVMKLLREFGARTSLRDGNPYRAKAYARAADSLTNLVVSLGQIIAEGRLTEIPASAMRSRTSSRSCAAQARIPALKRCARIFPPATPSNFCPAVIPPRP